MTEENKMPDEIYAQPVIYPGEDHSDSVDAYPDYFEGSTKYIRADLAQPAATGDRAALEELSQTPTMGAVMDEMAAQSALQISEDDNALTAAYQAGFEDGKRQPSQPIDSTPEWISTLDYQRDLAIIQAVAERSVDYTETIDDRISRISQLIVELKKREQKTTQPIDLDALKGDIWHDLQNTAPNCNVAYAVNWVIDHLAAQGYLNAHDWKKYFPDHESLEKASEDMNQTQQALSNLEERLSVKIPEIEGLDEALRAFTEGEEDYDQRMVMLRAARAYQALRGKN